MRTTTLVPALLLASLPIALAIHQEPIESRAFVDVIPGVPTTTAVLAGAVVPTGTFTDAGVVDHAGPEDLVALLCVIDLATFAGTVSQGTETLTPNGVILGAVDQCADIAPDLVAHVAANDVDDDDGDGLTGDWDKGRINCCDPGETLAIDPDDVEDLDGVGLDDGLWVLCLAVHDIGYEDYGWFWFDPLLNMTPLWVQPDNWDGRAESVDCATVGIAA